MLPDRGEGAEILGGSPADVAARIAEIVRGSGGLMAGILVIAEARQGELREVSFEPITAARELKERVGGPLAVAIIDADAGCSCGRAW